MASVAAANINIVLKYWNTQIDMNNILSNQNESGTITLTWRYENPVIQW